MRKYIFRCRLSLGDIVLLTGAIRDFCQCWPQGWAVDVRTYFPELWLHNRWLTPLGEYDPDVKVVDCAIPLVHQSGPAACHSLHAFLDFFNRYFGAQLKPSRFSGDIHLSRGEKLTRPPPCRLAEAEIPYWLICAGGKHDCTIKWWDARRYQEVVDRFRGRIQFVQVGDAAHYHPKLEGAIDLRGRTTVRELVQLVYHAQGIVCGVTALMHLAAATPRPRGQPAERPCVVIAGGREPPHWEAYPGHQFIHTVGALPCCASDGCWKSRTAPLGDGDPRDDPDQLCLDVRRQLPRCMDMISSDVVARRIALYFDGGVTRYLSAKQASAAERAVAATRRHDLTGKRPLNFHTAAEVSEQFIRSIPPYPQNGRGAGIVICAGGAQVFANAWVCIRMLRWLGCALPIELWHDGERELDARMARLLAPWQAECVDARQRPGAPARRLSHIWELKPHAILHSRFRDVLLLDADNVPAANPTFLFSTPQFRRAGAVFWPDAGRLDRADPAWKLFGVPFRDEPEFETGQLLIDKERCWRALNLCLWYNRNSRLYYHHVYGDKETFHFAFRKLNLPYAMPRRGIRALAGALCQHDFRGRRLFQHRSGAKWNFFGANKRVAGFWFERECRGFLKELASVWDGEIGAPATTQNLTGGPPPLTAAGSAPRLAVCMRTCPEREAVRQHTLDHLARSDWGDRPVRVEMDPRRFRQRQESLTHTAWLALRAGLQSGAEYLLCLEDDLGFNRRFYHNLSAWPLLRRRQIDVASLYNPGLAEFSRISGSQAIVVNPLLFFGTQALVLSRRAALYFLERWAEGPAEFDRKVGFLTDQLDATLVCHQPSLVEHVGRASMVGHRFHRARDYQPDWVHPDSSAPGLRIVALPPADLAKPPQVGLAIARRATAPDAHWLPPAPVWAHPPVWTRLPSWARAQSAE